MISVFEHPWLGGLFGDPECQEAWAAKRQFAHVLAFETALALALEHSGRVGAGMGKVAADALAGFQPDMSALRANTGTDGVPVPELVRQMRSAVGPGADAVHTGATSQDVLDTALALTLRDVTDTLLPRLAELTAALADLSLRYGRNPLMGRTRMQAGLPITVAVRLDPVETALRNQTARLGTLRPVVERLQLGGAVGTNEALGADATAIAAYMAEALNLTLPDKVWHTDRGGVVEYANAITLITGTLGKFGQDIALMSQQGIGEVELSGGGGSSAMPHKSNPIKAELLVTLARFNAGQVALMHQAMIHEQERSGSAWMLEWMVLPQITAATGRAISAAIELCGEVKRLGSQVG